MPRVLISVVETSGYLRAAKRFLTEGDLDAIATIVATEPTIGDIIPGAGGVRKFRYAFAGRGKRGGARVIYYFWDEAAPVYLLDAFAKNDKANLKRSETRALFEQAKEIGAAIRRQRGIR